MNILKYRPILYLFLLSLTFYTLTLPLNAVENKASFKQSILIGQFANGVKFQLIPGDNIQATVRVRIGSVALSYNRELIPFFYLLQFSLFEGTTHLSGLEICTRLAIYPNNHISCILRSSKNGTFEYEDTLQTLDDLKNESALCALIYNRIRFNELNQEMYFTLSNFYPTSFFPFFQMLNEVFFHPLLTDTGINLAKRQIIKQELYSEGGPAIQVISPQNIRDYYNRWYIPELMRIEIAGFTDRQAILEALTQSFGEIVELKEFYDQFPEWDFPMQSY